MISILIPTYNYNIQELVESLLLQLKNISSDWEIVLRDDASNVQFTQENLQFIQQINLTNVNYLISETNQGSAVNRNKLLQLAKYPWVLFLDDDVLPVRNNFIAKYIQLSEQKKAEVYTGNIQYKETEMKSKSLRYVYGKKYEETRLGLSENSATTANFMIIREIALQHPFKENLPNRYGHEDTVFFFELKDYKVESVDNPVYHMNWETNEVYLKKVKQSIENLEHLQNISPNEVANSTLLKTAKKYPFITQFLAKIYPIIKKQMESILIGNRPNVNVLQIYKWAYLGYLQRRKNRK